MFSDSWKAPMLTAASPKKHSVDLVLLLVLRGEGDAGRQRDVAADDRVAAEHARAPCRTGASTRPCRARRRRAAEQLGHHAAGVAALDERVHVIAVRRRRCSRPGASVEIAPTDTASWPMYRWQNPPIFCSAYISAHCSSNRRPSSIWCSRSTSCAFGVRQLAADVSGVVVVSAIPSADFVVRRRPARGRGRRLAPAGRDSTWPNPMLSAVAFSISNSSGMVVARDRQVRGRRAQVLPDREDAAADRPQVGERRDHLVPLLAEADHEARLGRDVRARSARARSSSSSVRG